MPRQRLSEILYLRVNKGFSKQFKREAGRYGHPADVHREILTAFIEGRVVLKPPSNPKLENLYES